MPIMSVWRLQGDNINVKYYLYIGKTFEDESESGNKTQMFVFPEDSLFVRVGTLSRCVPSFAHIILYRSRCVTFNLHII